MAGNKKINISGSFGKKVKEKIEEADEARKNFIAGIKSKLGKGAGTLNAAERRQLEALRKSQNK